MFVARAVVPITLFLGLMVGLYLGSALSLFKTIVALTVIWGAPILMIFLWRRLTDTAVRVQVVVSLLLIGVLPLVVSAIPALRQSPALTITTAARTVSLTIPATRADVEAGLATKIDQPIIRERRLEPVPIFFEDGLARSNLSDPRSAEEGVGRFNAEIYLLSLFGVNFQNWNRAELLTARYLVDSIVPFVILIGVSLVTRPTEKRRLDCFYARMDTPIGATPEDDRRELEKTCEQPQRFAHRKLFPGSDWEFTRWERADVIGFSLCCGIVVLILVFFEGVLSIGM
jgi:hypothetical protein